MKKSDRQLGMDRDISRRDFIHDLSLASLGLTLPAGFDVQKDILAITVNRWPHGYSYDYLDLWDPEWPEGQAPHEIARRPFGNIVIAGAGADAYTHVAIDEAWRAVVDLKRATRNQHA